MKFILDCTKLESGDIILTREKKPISIGVRYFSEGEYSHALYALSNTSLIEATLKGRVYTENPQRLIFDKIDDCKVLRYKGSLSDREISVMEAFLRSQVSTDYSVKEAIKTKQLSSTNSPAMEKSQFCSRLVAQAYYQINKELVINPNYCSPEDLNSSELLEIVPNAICLATQRQIDFSKQPSQIKENQKETYAWLDRSKSLARKEKFLINSQNDVLKFLIECPDYDKKICKFIQDTKYLTIYKLDEKVYPWRYKFFKTLDVVNEIAIAEEIIINKDLIKRNSQNYKDMHDVNKVYKLTYTKLMKKLYKEMLQQCSKRLDVLVNYVEIYPLDLKDKMTVLSEIEFLKKNIRLTLTDGGQNYF